MILITWDDWGGWYDHVSPTSSNGLGWQGYPGGGGNGVQYVYGFRVPLLVVSAYAKQHYISNSKHDFGSILNFIETTFNLLQRQNGIDPTYPYADQFVDVTRNGSTDLSDFFNCLQTSCAQPFQPIDVASVPSACNQNACGTNQCNVSCFINYKGSPLEPDTD